MRLNERCEFFGEETLKQLESQCAKQEAQKRLEDRRQQHIRKRARDLLGKMAPRASQHDGGGESEARRAPGCIEVGAVGQDVPGWCEVYIGRTPHWRDLYGTEGKGTGNPWHISFNASEAARKEACANCDALTEDPLGAELPEPEERGVWLVAAEATREQRAASIDRLVERVIDGDNVMLLCHCRRWGMRPCASNRCLAWRHAPRPNPSSLSARRDKNCGDVREGRSNAPHV